MAYLVTGATGFIGRFLVERLLAHDGDVHVLVRPGSEGKLARIATRWPNAERVQAVPGDLGSPGLGIDEAWIDAHRGRIDHVFHLAAIYDMTASEEQNEHLNNGGTRNAVTVANKLDAGRLHHTSSVAAAGLYRGTFTEDMFDEGQDLDHPYHRTKFESERIAREESEVPWRVYRPAIVVGHSKTGEMDKIDGPYYFFRALRMGARLPDFLPLLAPRMGETNVVPVDFVAAAMDYIGHQPGLDGQAFHLVSPDPQKTVDLLNVFAKVAGAPRMKAALPREAMELALRVPGVRSHALPAMGIPEQVIDYADFTARFDSRKTRAALAGSGIAVPPIEDYAPVLWRYWCDNLAGNGPG
jgi:thioester reductase-like protein